MRSKWKDWDYLNIWIFGTVAVFDLVPAIAFICAGEYAMGSWILAVSLYAGIAAWLSYRIWDDRFVERFMEKYTVARLPCGASIELVEVGTLYDPSVPGRYKKAESPATVLKVVGCRDVAYHGRHGCPRLRALSDFFVAERNASPVAGSDAGGVDEHGIPPVIYGFNGGERHCLPLNGIDFCFYPDAYTVPSPVPDSVEHGKKEAADAKDEASPVER